MKLILTLFFAGLALTWMVSLLVDYVLWREMERRSARRK